MPKVAVLGHFDRTVLLKDTMFDPPGRSVWRTTLSVSVCQHRDPAPASPAAPQSTCVTSATEGSAKESRAKAVLLSGQSVSWLPGVVGSFVCADAAGQGAEVAGREFSLPVAVGS